MFTALDHFFKLLHPFAPFITEEIWHHLFPFAPSISISKLGKTPVGSKNIAVSQGVDVIHRLITTIRTMRSETGVPPSAQVHVVVSAESPGVLDRIRESRSVISHLAKTGNLDIDHHPQIPPIRATSVTSDSIGVFLDLEGLVDVPMEISRLNKEIAKSEAELGKVTAKLGNANFVDRAPPDVVEKTRQIEAELSGRLSKLMDARNLFAGTGAL